MTPALVYAHLAVNPTAPPVGGVKAQRKYDLSNFYPKPLAFALAKIRYFLMPGVSVGRFGVQGPF